MRPELVARLPLELELKLLVVGLLAQHRRLAILEQQPQVEPVV
jgi:hypothetical protein